MALGAALERFGSDARLDALPFVCSACGAREIDVRPAYGGQPKMGGWHNVTSPLLKD
jgi:hypothetical protein